MHASLVHEDTKGLSFSEHAPFLSSTHLDKREIFKFEGNFVILDVSATRS